jgi:hypothetical protein
VPDFFHLTVPQLLIRLTPLPMAVASVIGLVRFRRLSPSLRYLAAGLAGFLLPLNLAGFVFLVLHRNNLFLMPIYTIGELWILVLVYKQALHSPAFTRLVPWLLGAFTCYAVLDTELARPDFIQFRPSQQILQSFIVLGLVGLYLRKLISELRVVRLAREPMFWVSAGLLIYFLGYLQIALFSNYLLQYSKALNMNVWAVHSLLFIVLYLCYCRALWLPPQK